MKHLFQILICIQFLLSPVFLHANDVPDVVAMKGVVNRLLPGYTEKFVFQKLSAEDTADCFVVSSYQNKVRIQGNDALSMAVGLNYYLNQFCHTTVSWYAEEPVIMPRVLPLPAVSIKGQAKVKKRFFLNYCTYGYTMPFFTWTDWERMIDWMALQGVNMPLCITGQEYVYYQLWKELGMTDQEIRSYFTGPTYLPWHRMANIDGWNGPLPMEWLEQQKELQQRILKRARSLNMKPVLPAFSGHVPRQLKRIYPKANIQYLGQWAGFDNRYRCHFLNPEDSLFAFIQKEYLKRQAAVFGTDHIYGVDPFNEVDPPSWEPAYLGAIARNVHRTLLQADAQAEWLQMAWMFYFDRKKWTPERIKAFLTGVPQGKMMLLDYHCEKTELWKTTHSFHGQPFVWCYLGNFGGNTVLQGNVKESGRRIDDLLRLYPSNLMGIGSTLEGMDVQQFPYEYILGKAWSTHPSDSVFIRQLAHRHSGYESSELTKAWQMLFHDIHVQVPNTYAILPCLRPVLNNNHHGRTHIQYSDDKLREVWRLLVRLPRAQRSALRIDLITVGRQVLGNMFTSVKTDFDSAYAQRNLPMMRSKYQRMMDIIADLDQLTSYHPRCTLDRWLDDAKAMGVTPEQKNYYETNARNLITTWGGTLNDNASRGWSGLFRDYYAKRWLMYGEDVMRAVQNEESFDAKAFEQKMRVFEEQWVREHSVSYKIYGGDVLSFSKALVNKYLYP